MKLHYFDIAGRGGHLRLALKIAKIPFEEVNYTVTEWGPELKDKFPMGQLPVLEFDDGCQLNQMEAIGEYIGRKAGWMGIDPKEDAWVRMTVGNLFDIQWRARRLENIETELLPYIKGFEHYLSTKAKDGYVLGDSKKETIADLAIFSVLAQNPYFDVYKIAQKMMHENAPTAVQIARRVAGEHKDLISQYSAHFHQI